LRKDIIENLDSSRFSFNISSKLASKNLKQDSFILENYSKKDISHPRDESIKMKKTQISFLKHVKFKIKNVFGLKLSNMDEMYKILDDGFQNDMTGNFLFTKMQEFDCFKKIVFSSRQMALFNSIEKPSLELNVNKLLLNMENNKFGLFPSVQFDEQKRSTNVEEIFGEKLDGRRNFILKKNEKLIKLIQSLK